jgi:hypothetical protein
VILPIKHKRGTTIPTANDLVVGEIAINTATGLCYTKTGAGNVVAIGLDVAANWGNIGGTLSSQTDLQSALDDKYDASNPDGYIPEANVDGTLYGRKNGLWEVIVADGNNIPDYDNFVTYSAGAQVYFQGKLYRMVNTAGAAGYDPIGHPSYWESLSGTSPDLTGYATESWVQSQGYLLPGAFGTVPSGGLTGQVLTKDSSLDYAHSWVTPIVGDRYLTTSTTSNAVSNGAKTFTIGTGLSYTPQQDVVISAVGVTAHMHALVTSYNSLSGALVVDVQHHTGNGTYTNWVVNVGGIVPLESVSWGGITGTLTNQTDLVDALALKANKSGDTFTGKVGFTPSSTNASINIGTVTSAPTSLVNGDIWIGSSLNFRGSNGFSNTVASLGVANQFSTNQIIQGSGTLPMLRVTQGGTGHSFVVEDNNPDTTAFIINNVGAVGIQKDPATWTHLTSTPLDVTGRAMFIPINSNTPSLNLGAACNSTPTSAMAGDVWITNAASPKLAFQIGGVNYYCVVANQFNTFTGQVAISGSSATNPQLQITQTGAGNALVVEDSASPDTNSFVVNGAGSVGIGVSPVSGAWTPTRKLEVVGSISCTTESATTDSIDVATTAHVKSVMRGQVLSDASETYSLPFSGILPNVIVKKANDGTGNTTYIEVPYNVIPVGTQFVLIQVGSYPFVVQPASGVTVNSSGNKYRSGGEHSVCTLIKTDTNEWYLAGDLTT